FAEGVLLALIAGEPGRYTIRHCRLGEACCLSKACRIERRLGDACAHMRPRHERGVAQERNAPEDDAWRFEIEDRLEERLLGARKYFRELRSNKGAGGSLDAGQYVRPDQRRWNAGSVTYARGIGAALGQRFVGTGRAIAGHVVSSVPDVR